MAYEVTKRIGAQQYRYRVEGYRDPETKRVKQRWTYLGRLRGDTVVDARKHPEKAPDDRIVAAILKLLETRDVELLTIDVIARAAHVSRGTFYRYFDDKTAALRAAIESVYNEILDAPLSLDAPISSLEVERRRLAQWIDALVAAIVLRPGVHRALTKSPQLAELRSCQAAINKAEVRRSLLHYLERLELAGLIETDSPELLAAGIMSVTHGIFKQLIHDRREDESPSLTASGVDIVCRAVFGPRVRRRTSDASARSRPALRRSARGSE